MLNVITIFFHNKNVALRLLNSSIIMTTFLIQKVCVESNWSFIKFNKILQSY